ncbi:glycosyl hydrolases family 35-domain-containing protein [Scenedesmus sp. NREL 46B-D3]|nr:glycosyl hydrolases family 35-domain-containing protein [Scenedesmus sp. NREL 46B-D3]
MARIAAGTAGCVTLGTAMAVCVASAIFLAAAPPRQWQRPVQHAQAPGGGPLLAAAPLDATSNSSSSSRSFTIRNDRFMKNGVPFRLISGSLHYNRIPPDLWADRLARAKALGLNAVQLYVPWNFHQPRPGPEGVLPFEGWRDVAGFIRTAGEMGLLVLLRPGPYICAEWEFGGLPAWLLQQDPAMPLRSADAAFLAAVDAWWGALLPQLAPLTYERGGPIAMVQVENEYGYYGGSKPYLRHLADLIRQHMGQQVLLYTVDGASLLPVAMGSLPGRGVLTTVDFGPTTDVDKAFALQKSFNPPGRPPPSVWSTTPAGSRTGGSPWRIPRLLTWRAPWPTYWLPPTALPQSACTWQQAAPTLGPGQEPTCSRSWDWCSSCQASAVALAAGRAATAAAAAAQGHSGQQQQ